MNVCWKRKKTITLVGTKLDISLFLNGGLEYVDGVTHPHREL